MRDTDWLNEPLYNTPGRASRGPGLPGIDALPNRMKANRILEPLSREVIVCHPLNIAALRVAFPARSPGVEARGQHAAELLARFDGIEVVTNDLLPRWFVEWQPPDWGPCWKLGPEDEKTLAPLGFGRRVEIVGKPAFFKIARALVFGGGSIVSDMIKRHGRQW